ncbi:MAG: N-acetylneuraminate synthase [SAR324 cluster bacterium]|uniref:N-acetylneuraminate synthase n=1 Tax=SAR324 cluster bacterium TaxID=2024889 RepID=A0A2A4T6U2_9DELT|nr:MAG: N-acetylneuraminate synthase [SAR324 cluster bacterium]
MIYIGDKPIGPRLPTLLMAEVAQAHDGSLGAAHTFVDVVAGAGFDAIKFQTHIARAESTEDEPFRIRFSQQDQTRYEYWKRMEFTEDQWVGLAQHAQDRGLLFLSSAFSLEAVDFLTKIGMPAWKVGSGEFRSWELIKRMAATGKPILLSTGMSRWQEMDQMVEYIRSLGNDLVIFQCTSKYPTPLEDVGLNLIDNIKIKYQCMSGLSDHSGTIWPALAAMAQGVDIVEVHVTLHTEAFGPDVPASLTPDQLHLLSDGRNAFSTMDSSPVDKDQQANELAEIRKIFTKSIGLVNDLPVGTLLSEAMLIAKKPGGGIPLADVPKVTGKRLLQDVSCTRLLKWEDIEK